MIKNEAFRLKKADSFISFILLKMTYFYMFFLKFFVFIVIL